MKARQVESWSMASCIQEEFFHLLSIAKFYSDVVHGFRFVTVIKTSSPCVLRV